MLTRPSSALCIRPYPSLPLRPSSASHLRPSSAPYLRPSSALQRSSSLQVLSSKRKAMKPGCDDPLLRKRKRLDGISQAAGDRRRNRENSVSKNKREISLIYKQKQNKLRQKIGQGRSPFTSTLYLGGSYIRITSDLGSLRSHCSVVPPPENLLDKKFRDDVKELIVRLENLREGTEDLGSRVAEKRAETSCVFGNVEAGISRALSLYH